MEVKNSKGTVDRHLVEIKPNAERYPPKAPKRKTAKAMDRYSSAMLTYAINQAKWEAAKEFCELNDIIWRVMDEYDLGISKKPKS
jgi:hypothetical protein